MSTAAIIIVGLALLVLLAPVVVAWLRHRAEPLAVVVSYGAPAPLSQVRDATPDMRTPEQKLADQQRVNDLGFPRGI